MNSYNIYCINKYIYQYFCNNMSNKRMIGGIQKLNVFSTSKEKITFGKQNNLINWNKINIMDTLGFGHNGTTYRIKINGNKKEYAMKRQKISYDEYKSNISDNLQINNELKFFQWIDGLGADDQIFFMTLYGYRRYRCDFNFIPNSGTETEEMKYRQAYCQDMIVDLKGRTFNQIIDGLTRNEILSIFCQIVHAIGLMHTSGYFHTDSRTENICCDKTSKEYLIDGSNDQYKIKTYGWTASLIDYGNVVSESMHPDYITLDMIQVHKKFNVDIWLLIDSILLNNVYLFKQIDAKKVGFKPKEVFEMTKLILHIFPKTYNRIIGLIEQGTDLNQAIQSNETYEEFKKDYLNKTLAYNFIQYLQVYRPNKFKKIIKKYFGKSVKLSDIIEYVLIKKVMKNIANTDGIIIFISQSM